jgi:RNA polymerase sigma-70 factor (ECF subfamily)
MSADRGRQACPMPEDNDIIRRVVAGEIEAFRLLVERHQRAVFRMVGGFLADAHRREDAAQEAFLRAYRRLATFDPARGRFSTWLLAIARNVCRNALRSRSPAIVANPPDVADPRTPYDDLAEKELFAELDRALASLPEPQKAAFVLAELVGLPHDEIARIEGIEPGTVRSRLSRAKRKLREMLRAFQGAET